ncbi:R3H domain [Nesidiocoris tenuis]|uniref:R3H domain n=1 Tax=Nesidiocoris tenuis TaxID=355587 RepID=A0ABN7B891_9HEMI|nr:R3H domain [Nesidiocoris tenuis]
MLRLTRINPRIDFAAYKWHRQSSIDGRRVGKRRFVQDSQLSIESCEYTVKSALSPIPRIPPRFHQESFIPERLQRPLELKSRVSTNKWRNLSIILVLSQHDSLRFGFFHLQENISPGMSNWEWSNSDGQGYQPNRRDIWSNGTVYFNQSPSVSGSGPVSYDNPISSGGTTFYGPPPFSADWSQSGQHQGYSQGNSNSGRSRNAEEFFDLFRNSSGGSGHRNSSRPSSGVVGHDRSQGDYVGPFDYLAGAAAAPSSSDHGGYGSSQFAYNSSNSNNNYNSDWRSERDQGQGQAPGSSIIAVGGPTTQTFGKAPGGPLGTVGSGGHPRHHHGGGHKEKNGANSEPGGSYRGKKGSDRLYRQPGRNSRSFVDGFQNGGTVYYNQSNSGSNGPMNGSGNGRPAKHYNGGNWEAKSLGRRQLLNEAAAILRNDSPGIGGMLERKPTDLRYDGGNDGMTVLSPGGNGGRGGRTCTGAPPRNQNSYASAPGGGRRNYPVKTREFQKSNSREDWKARNLKSTGDDKVTADQRERLTEQLCRGTLECLVCYDRIRQAERVWSCANCHHVLHLDCIVKWVNSSTESTGGESGWRCPACQNVTQIIPTEYKCMCGRVTEPQWVRGETPHCCGQVCGKRKGCPHGCTLLCHPGACPPCAANIERQCGCGRTSRTVTCSSSVTFNCDDKCGRPLNCGVHACEVICHQGPCAACEKTIHQRCHCGEHERDLVCDGDVLPEEMGGSVTYSCGSPCTLRLPCGVHPCHLTCHSPPCPPCPLSPDVLTKCQCGKTDVAKDARKSCADPVVVCGDVCGKQLNCGQPESRHKCKAKCHEGPCPPCDESTSVLCRCHAMAKDVSCKELTGNPEDTKCQRRCTKKRNCGKHKCNQLCCVEVEHICPLVCNKTLNCGRHKCERLCHRGHCPPCLAASFEELHCECGKSVILPPVPCGTRAPECKEKCTREHPCGHAPLHSCHSAPECPPCTVFVSRYCHGAHELRKTVPCHMGEYSCGLPCGKVLPCGHKCIKTCHKDECLLPKEICTQPCTEPREGSCSHPCASPCHKGRPCPQTNPCLAKVEVTCECNRRKMTRTCTENSSEYKRIATSILASKMADVRMGKSIDTSDMSAVVSKLSLKTLECNDECKLQERNLRLAIGLQIANPDLSSKLHPRYSDTMKAWVKKDRHFCEMVHEKLTQLVRLAKTSKQRSRAHSFQSMGSAKRQFIHEYCEHFGIESVAYDPEPNRNIVATAWKDKCWLPSLSVLEVVARESGHRKVPSLLPSLKKDLSTTESTKLVSPLKPKSAQQTHDDPAK